MTPDQFIAEHRHLALWIARGYCKAADQQHHDDIVSDALWGLYNAAEGYDATRGASPTTHASRTIRRRIVDGMRERHGRSGWSKGDAVHVELEPCHDYGVAGGEEAASDAIALWQMLDTLNPVQRRVVVRTYLDGESLSVVAYEMGVTESRVCQIRSAAMVKLKKLC